MCQQQSYHQLFLQIIEQKVWSQGRTQDICKGGSIKLKAGGLGGTAPQMLKGICFFHSLILTIISFFTYSISPASLLGDLLLLCPEGLEAVLLWLQKDPVSLLAQVEQSRAWGNEKHSIDRGWTRLCTHWKLFEMSCYTMHCNFFNTILADMKKLWLCRKSGEQTHTAK